MFGWSLCRKCWKLLGKLYELRQYKTLDDKLGPRALQVPSNGRWWWGKISQSLLSAERPKCIGNEHLLVPVFAELVYFQRHLEA